MVPSDRSSPYESPERPERHYWEIAFDGVITKQNVKNLIHQSCGFMVNKATTLTFFCFIFLLFVQPIVHGGIPPELVDCRELIRQGKFDEAREELEKFRRKQPDNLAGLFLLAQLEGDIDKALAIFREVEILAVDPRVLDV